MSRDGREALDMRTAWTRRVAIEEVARQVSAEMKRTDQQGLDTFAPLPLTRAVRSKLRTDSPEHKNSH